MTTIESYTKCSVCERELAEGETCTEHPDGYRASATRQIPKLSDEGKPLFKLVYEIRSPTEVKKSKTAGTLDTAVDAIVATLAALPAELQKKAINAARARLFPKADKTDETTAA